MIDSKHILTLPNFARDTGLTGEQVVAEVKAGRLAVTVLDDDQVVTSKYDALDWAARRAVAISILGDGVEFPVYDCDHRSFEEVPSTAPRTEALN